MTGEPTKAPRDEHDQPLPVKNEHRVIQEIVMDDLCARGSSAAQLVREDVGARLQVGIERYGTGLQPHNGRDMLKDAYDEALDLAIYLCGCMIESGGTAFGCEYSDALTLAQRLRIYLQRRDGV